MIAFVLGTRPEVIKVAPVVHELAARSEPFAIVHTGQHYTPSLDEIFFDELALPPPVVNLHVGSGAPVPQVAAIMVGVAEALERMRPACVMVQGDTNSVLGGALAAFKLGIRVAHLEAGLRSDDWTMPEEGNRVLAGRVSSLHFCPTNVQAERLRGEGIERGVHVVGNTIVDASLRYVETARTRSTVLDAIGVASQRFALVTLHRPSNVDDPVRFAALVRALAHVGRAMGLRIVFPIHPRARQRARAFGLEAALAQDPFVTTEPVGYLDMLRLVDASAVVLTDSGGVQEEACTLRVPCVTLRANTERPETVTVGANVLCDSSDERAVLSAVTTMAGRPRDWKNPLGDGRTAVRVCDTLLDFVTGSVSHHDPTARSPR